MALPPFNGLSLCAGDSSYWPTPTVSCRGDWPHAVIGPNGFLWQEPQKANQVGLNQCAAAWRIFWDFLVHLVGVEALAAGSCRSSSLPVRVRLQPGPSSLEERPACNPRFGEMMMGWPDGWTDISSPVTGFAPWLRRARTALSMLS